MTREDIFKKIGAADLVISVIESADRPILMHKIEKEVTKEALREYIDKLRDLL